MSPVKQPGSPKQPTAPVCVYLQLSVSPGRTLPQLPLAGKSPTPVFPVMLNATETPIADDTNDVRQVTPGLRQELTQLLLRAVQHIRGAPVVRAAAPQIEIFLLLH